MDEQLQKVQELIENGELEEAQKVLDTVEEKSGEKCFLQGKLFMEKSWFSEARKCFKQAVKLDPSNAEYRQALDGLNEFRKTKEYKKARLNAAKKQMGSTDGLAEVCFLCGCEVCGTGCCEAMCDGCS